MQHREKVPRIVISDKDHERLSELAESIAHTSPSIYEYLSRELERATLVSEDKMASYIVRMNSHVTYRDNANDKVRSVTLTYPKVADITENRISVLTPIGAALLGMSRGQTIDWLSPTQERATLTVLDVQPGSDEIAG